MPQKYTNEILEKAYDLIVNKKYSANKASKELKIDNGTMRKRLKEKYGEIFLPDGKKKVNSSYFEIIDTEEKAYWLGMLTADGYVSQKNDIEFALKESDKYHVDNFKKAISSEHAVSIKKAILNEKEFFSYRINLRDTKMSNDLKSYGLSNTKSYDAYIPSDKIPVNLMRHYIRGYFDGDGCIYKVGSNRLNISMISASEQMAKDLISVVNYHLDINLMPREIRNLYEVRLFSQFKVEKFLDWLYKDSTIYLNRKHNKYIAVLS